MSDKERLETIKEFVKKIESILYDEWRQQELTILIESFYYDDHVDWLINRVEELEKQNERLTMLLNDKSYERDRSTVIIAQLQMELDKYKKMYEKGA